MQFYLGKTEEFTKTISESDVYLFAGITGDLNPLHVDEVTAAGSSFGGRIVHGILLGGVISGVIGMKLPGPGTIYMEQDLKFLKPVKIGDTVTARVTVSRILNTAKRILELSTTVINQDGVLVADGYAVVKAPEETEWKG